MSTLENATTADTQSKEEHLKLEDALWDAPLANTLEARVLLHKVLPRITDITTGDIENICVTEEGISVSCSWTGYYRGCRGETHTESYDIPWAVLLSEDSMDAWKEGLKAEKEARRKAEEEKRQKEMEKRQRLALEAKERNDYERLKAKYG